jgi:hypothetical protein
MRSISRNRILLIRYFIGLLAGGYFLFTIQLQAKMPVAGYQREDSLRMAQLSVSDKPFVSMAVRPVEL